MKSNSLSPVHGLSKKTCLYIIHCGSLLTGWVPNLCGPTRTVVHSVQDGGRVQTQWE